MINGLFLEFSLLKNETNKNQGIKVEMLPNIIGVINRKSTTQPVAMDSH